MPITIWRYADVYPYCVMSDVTQHTALERKEGGVFENLSVLCPVMLRGEKNSNPTPKVDIYNVYIRALAARHFKKG